MAFEPHCSLTESCKLIKLLSNGPCRRSSDSIISRERSVFNPKLAMFGHGALTVKIAMQASLALLRQETSSA